MTASEAKYWRVRMKYGAYEELTREAWDRDEVGIWYGAWGARDWRAASVSKDPLRYLSRINRKAGMNWKMRANDVSLVERFVNIDPRDWVLVYFDNTLSLAHVCSEIRSAVDHPLNRVLETFKYRKIKRKKSFSLDRLPDAFRLLRAAGRGNVFQPRGCGELVKLLGASANEREVASLLEEKELDEFLELLGPTSWESVCQAYLSLEHSFVPTGLRYGGILPDFDIVGRRATDGTRILAQCKKTPHPVFIQDGFLSAVGKPAKGLIAFYFAFAGCMGEIPPHIRVIDRDAIASWSMTRAGKRYFRWLRGE
jgi:hypothetical protein